MPVGLFALVAVGVHAAADTLDGRILWVIDHANSWLNSLLGAWGLTNSQRTFLARALTLAWELAADAVVALPALGYREEDASARRPRRLVQKPRTFADLVRRAVRQPTLSRLLRPPATAALVLAAACSIAGMVQGALFLSLRSEALPDAFAGPLSRGAAIAALVAVSFAFGWRAVLRSLQSVDQLAEAAAKTRLRAFSAGLLGTGLVLPLALAAALDAAPVWAFFR